VLDFENVKEMYAKDDDFKAILEKCSQHGHASLREWLFYSRALGFASQRVALGSC